MFHWSTCSNEIAPFWGVVVVVVCFSLIYLCDFKFLRANGGCLGIWSRRRTYESAISLGELINEL